MKDRHQESVLAEAVVGPREYLSKIRDQTSGYRHLATPDESPISPLLPIDLSRVADFASTRALGGLDALKDTKRQQFGITLGRAFFDIAGPPIADIRLY